MSDFELNVTIREDMGKGASRRLRRLAGNVPAIVYGGSDAPKTISVEERELKKALENEAFYSHIITLKGEGVDESVVLKDLQRHPAKNRILHADFMRVVKGQKFVTKVPLHFINEETAKGVKIQGGVVNHTMTEIEISVLPKDLPEFIEVDMLNVELDQIVHLSDLKLPEGVESVALSHGADHDLPVAAIHKPKRQAAAEGADEGEEADGKDEE